MVNHVKSYLEFVNESNDLKDVIVTVPKSTSWEVYQKELKAAEAGSIMNFKVNHFPKTGPGKKCYVVHDGYIRGYMIISGLKEKDFTCTTTGKIWAGKFIERTGKFYPVNPIPMKGFQGFKYFNQL